MTRAAQGAIALLGTSADPPTCGHQALLEALLERYPRVATWASDNPMKRHGAPLAARSALLAALVGAIADPRLEHAQDLSSPWAITTLERAAARWPSQELIFVVGSDLAGQIPSWKQADAVLRRGGRATGPRAGGPPHPADLAALEALGAHIELLPLTVPASTSTALRQRPDPAGIPAAVWPVLLQHNLYGLSPEGPTPADPARS
jgi:nicotinate-nucleotide adenylyltransferase